MTCKEIISIFVIKTVKMLKQLINFKILNIIYGNIPGLSSANLKEADNASSGQHQADSALRLGSAALRDGNWRISSQYPITQKLTLLRLTVAPIGEM